MIIFNTNYEENLGNLKQTTKYQQTLIFIFQTLLRIMALLPVVTGERFHSFGIL